MRLRPEGSVLPNTKIPPLDTTWDQFCEPPIVACFLRFVLMISALRSNGVSDGCPATFYVSRINANIQINFIRRDVNTVATLS